MPGRTGIAPYLFYYLMSGAAEDIPGIRPGFHHPNFEQSVRLQTPAPGAVTCDIFCARKHASREAFLLPKDVL